MRKASPTTVIGETKVISSIKPWDGKEIGNIKVAQGDLSMEPIMKWYHMENFYQETFKEPKLRWEELWNNMELAFDILEGLHQKNDK